MKHPVTPLALLFAATLLPAQGVTDTEIVLGQACALKGQAAGLGTGMQTGLQVWFDKVNAQGGVNGRKVRLVSVNDGYEPERCVQAVKMLIEQEKVFAIVGGVGTPTAKVAIPVCTDAKVPFVGAFTGAELLRSPHNRYVVNVRASYFQETEQLAKHLVDQNGMKRVACFYQDDAYGQAGLEGIKRALASRKMELVATGTYKRNTLAIAEGLQAVAAGKPEAVVLVGAYAPCAEMMRQAKKQAGLENTTMCNISFVGTDNLLKAVGSDGENSIISQVVPYPHDGSVAVVADYLADMNKAGKTGEVGFISLEGYMVGRFFTEMAKQCGKELTRDALLATIEKSGDFDLGGLKLSFGAQDNQGSDSVFLTTIKNGKVVPLQAATAAPAK
ncbi:MAG: ABC transporter substrate-binding protein [Planctomycetes bacterium]|nr:ABC transporter substrate-binding protein [Planctomycetota bacterium]